MLRFCGLSRLAIAAILACAPVGGVIFSSAVYAAQAVPAAPVDVPFQLNAGHVYVDLEINGQGPFHFIFDTGAPNVLAPAAAERLKLTVRADVKANGTGGTQNGGSTDVDTVRLGGLTLEKQTFYVLDLPPAPDGVPVDGLIGFEWLQRFATRLDYARSTLTFYPAKGASYGGQAPATPLYFRGKTPLIDGAVDGMSGRFSIDTGSNGSLTLYAPFVETHGLVARYHAKTKVMSAVGIGGPVYALMARAGQLDLGSAKVERPVTFLSQQIAGTSIRKDTAGNIGFGVLRQFTIFFDYPRSKIYFEPNGQWGQPDLADRSGLRVENGQGGFSIAYVAENSPAMAAGLKAGDRIVAVNGVRFDAISLTDVRAQLKGPVGSRVSIMLDHDDAPVVVELKDL